MSGKFRRTPLREVCIGLVATMCPFASWSTPLRHRRERAEPLAVRSGAGLFDR